MVEIESITVRLGERDFIITEAPTLRSKPWRARLMTEIKPIFEQVGGLSTLQFQTAADLFKLYPVVENLLVDAVDSVFELLIAYAPDLDAERAYIEGHATDRQLLAAFQEVVRLADPFGIVRQMTRQIGRSTNGNASS